MNNYHLYEEIGHGKLSTVYKGRRRGTIQYVAIKSVDKTKRSRVMNEVSISNDLGESLLPAPQVCQLLNWYETRNHLWTVSEYCAGGDLGKILKEDEKISPESHESQIFQFSNQLLSGLLTLHAAGIVFADMKPGNVLFTESGEIKLSGFAVSQRVSDLELALDEHRQVPRRGSPFYMAPELFRESGFHSFASDLWGLGVVLHEIATGHTPFSTCDSFQELQRQVTAPSPTPLGKISNDHLRSLLQRLLEKDPSARIGWKELLAHPWWREEGKAEWTTLVETKIAPAETRFRQRFAPRAPPVLSKRRNSSFDEFPHRTIRE